MKHRSIRQFYVTGLASGLSSNKFNAVVSQTIMKAKGGCFPCETKTEILVYEIIFKNRILYEKVTSIKIIITDVWTRFEKLSLLP